MPFFDQRYQIWRALPYLPNFVVFNGPPNPTPYQITKESGLLVIGATTGVDPGDVYLPAITENNQNRLIYIAKRSLDANDMRVYVAPGSTDQILNQASGVALFEDVPQNDGRLYIAKTLPAAGSIPAGNYWMTLFATS